MLRGSVLSLNHGKWSLNCLALGQFWSDGIIYLSTCNHPVYFYSVWDSISTVRSTTFDRRTVTLVTWPARNSNQPILVLVPLYLLLECNTPGGYGLCSPSWGVAEAGSPSWTCWSMPLPLEVAGILIPWRVLIEQLNSCSYRFCFLLNFSNLILLILLVEGLWKWCPICNLKSFLAPTYWNLSWNNCLSLSDGGATVVVTLKSSQTEVFSLQVFSFLPFTLPRMKPSIAFAVCVQHLRGLAFRALLSRRKHWFEPCNQIWTSCWFQQLTVSLGVGWSGWIFHCIFLTICRIVTVILFGSWILLKLQVWFSWATIVFSHSSCQRLILNCCWKYLGEEFCTFFFSFSNGIWKVNWILLVHLLRSDLAGFNAGV